MFFDLIMFVCLDLIVSFSLFLRAMNDEVKIGIEGLKKIHLIGDACGIKMRL